MRKFQSEAEAFLVWREGNALNWKVTQAALAKACNLLPARVQYICKTRGWVCLGDEEEMQLKRQSYLPDLVTLMTLTR